MSILSRILSLLVMAYRLLISPLLPLQCRYMPTCSDYALQALRQKPLPTALKLIVMRIGRCHPWGGHGYDPLPGATTPASSKATATTHPSHSEAHR